MTGSSNRSWGFRFVLVAAVLAFVFFSFAPALKPLFSSSSSRPVAQSAAPDTTFLQREAEGYRLVLAREPDNVTAARGLTEDLLRLGQIAEAIAPLQHWVELEPENFELATQLGLLQAQAGDFEGAATTLRAQYVRSPERTDILESLVDVQMAQGDADGAIALLETRFQDKQQSSSNTANSESAKPSGSVSNEIASQSVNTALLLARTYVRAERFEEGMGLYDRIMSDQPTNYRAPLEKAIALSTSAIDQEQVGEPLWDASLLFELAASKAPESTAKSIEEMAQQYASLAEARALVGSGNTPEMTEDGAEDDGVTEDTTDAEGYGEDGLVK